MKSISKVASGGELSRIMLALKSVMADKEEISTSIKIVQIRKNLKENIGKYRVGAQFMALNNNEIEHISKSQVIDTQVHKPKNIRLYLRAVRNQWGILNRG